MSHPKVSLVMPTYNRHEYVPIALRSFLQQTYQNIELIIVNDGGDFFHLPLDSRIHSVYLDKRTPTGTKRNIGAEIATGEIIANLDDDDWSMAHRIETQVERLITFGKAVTGYNQTISYDETTGNFYKNQGGPPYFASGTSQCYWKSWWKRHPYPDVTYGEDSVFARVARLADQLAIVEPGKMMVARKHKNNTDPVHVKWLKKIDSSFIHTDFFRAVENPSFIDTYLNEKHVCCGECHEELKRDFLAPIVDYKVEHLPEIKTR